MQTLFRLLRFAPTLYLLGAVLLPFFSSRGRRLPRRVGGRIEFLPHPLTNWVWPPMALGALWFAYTGLAGTKLQFYDLSAAFCYAALSVGHLFEHPGTIVATDQGLEQLYWLRPDKRIAWNEIDAIEIGRPSSPIVIANAEGTRIVYWNSLSGRSQLIQELNEHCHGNLPPEFPAS